MNSDYFKKELKNLLKEKKLSHPDFNQLNEYQKKIRHHLLEKLIEYKKHKQKNLTIDHKLITEINEIIFSNLFFVNIAGIFKVKIDPINNKRILIKESSNDDDKKELSILPFLLLIRKLDIPFDEKNYNHNFSFSFKMSSNSKLTFNEIHTVNMHIQAFNSTKEIKERALEQYLNSYKNMIQHSIKDETQKEQLIMSLNSYSIQLEKRNLDDSIRQAKSNTIKIKL